MDLPPLVRTCPECRANLLRARRGVSRGLTERQQPAPSRRSGLSLPGPVPGANCHAPVRRQDRQLRARPQRRHSLRPDSGRACKFSDASRRAKPETLRRPKARCSYVAGSLKPKTRFVPNCANVADSDWVSTRGRGPNQRVASQWLARAIARGWVTSRAASAARTDGRGSTAPHGTPRLRGRRSSYRRSARHR